MKIFNAYVIPTKIILAINVLYTDTVTQVLLQYGETGKEQVSEIVGKFGL